MAVGKKTGGRKKGTPNKNTAAVKDAILKAFDQVGDVKYLVTVAREDPKTFCTLLGKVVPAEVSNKISGDEESPLVTEVRWKITG